MHPPHHEPVHFKFNWINEQGAETGFLRKRGSFDGETLALDDVQVPVAVITHCEVRDKRMIVGALTNSGETAVLVFAVSSVGVTFLKSALDIARSAQWAEFHKEDLRKKGRAHAFRSERCPQCGATLVLTDMPRTPQLYCRFCDTLMTLDPTVETPPGERHLKVCDECGMFSSPSKFTIFYFYFLLVVYGFWHKTTWRCPACMRGDAWKMFFGNLPFLIGVPVAVVQLVRSYRGSILGGAFKGLDAANLKARKGDVVGALQGYRGILERVPYSAGLKYNLGVALRRQNDVSRAAGAFEAALKDCGNYVPAYHQLTECYQALGETEKLAELNAAWGREDSEEAEEIEDLA